MPPILASHNLMVLSYDPDTMHLPSGENATDVTQFSWLSRGGCSISPVSASHNQMVLSSDPDTMCLPSGENTTDQT